MSKEEGAAFAEVFTGEYWEASLIQQWLEKNSIQAFLRNDLAEGIEALAISAGGAGIVAIQVPLSDYPEAIRLIYEFNAETSEK